MKTDFAGKLSIKEKIGYALGDTGANIAWRPLISFLPFFYTDVFVLPAAAVTWLLLIPRISDGFTDIIMGTIADRTNSKWGKFRPWLLWTALPFGLLLALTFTTPTFNQTGKLIWAYATYILLTLAYTANNVPYNALIGVMTPSHKERTSLVSFRFFGAFAGGALAYFLIEPFVKLLGGENEAKGYQYTFFIFALMLAIFSFITFISVKERIKPVSSKNNQLKDDFLDAIKNKPWLIIIIIGFLFVVFNSIKQGIAIYYFKHYLHKDGVGGIYLGVLVLVSMGTAMITPFLSKTLGKKPLFQYSMIFTGVFTLILYIIPKDQVTLFFVIGCISEIGAAILPILFFAMLADTADYSEWKTGRRATALVFSAGTFAMKSGGAIAGAIMLTILSWFGYVEGGVEQSKEALMGIRLNMSIVPTIVIAIAVVIMLFYPLTTEKMNQIEKELKANRNTD